MGFFSKLARKGIKKRVAQMPRRRGGFLRGMPMMKPSMGDMRFRGEMPRGGSFGFGLGEAIRRLNEQQRMMPQPIPRAEIDISALERLPMGDMPMTQDLPEVAPIEMMPQMRMSGMQDMQPRMMMAEGDEASTESLIDFLNSDPEQVDFGKSVSNESQKQFDYLTDILKRTESSEEKIQLLNQIKDTFGRDLLMNIASGNVVGRDFSNLDREIASKLYIGVSPEDILRPKYSDALKGYAEGDEVIMEENEIDAMLGGMDSEEAGAMEDLEQMAPEMEMIDQLVTMVVQMIQQGASEEEVIMFLREQGLDDEDIGTVLQLVAEMAEAEAMPQDGIGAELEQLV